MCSKRYVEKRIGKTDAIFYEFNNCYLEFGNVISYNAMNNGEYKHMRYDSATASYIIGGTSRHW